MIGEIAALITALLWSGTSIVFTEASVRVGSFYVNVARLIIAMFCLALTVLIFQIEINLSTSQILNLVLSGIIGLIIGDTFLFKAFQNIGARLSMLIMASVPGISAILAFIFLGEKISFTGIIGMLITILGIAIVVLNRQEKPSSDYKIDYIGIFYAFMGAVGQAVGLIFAKNAFNESDINGFVAAFIRISASVIFMYPLFVFITKIKNPFSIFRNNKTALIYTLIGSVIGPFLGITFSLISVAHTKVGIASTLMSTVPIIMLPLVKFYYKEKLTWIAIIGAFLAVGGVAMLFLK
ncbi:MAG: DMT family transporter [Melioribacter sp.]|uniref:DMT family transporter n=1 Tax=Rosettibacter primus TaxID=3111523 RepID=UPI00247BBC70|nr:DMT family transporter [Melioribacter sp.]